MSSRLASLSSPGLRQLSIGGPVQRETVKSLGKYDSPEEESLAMKMLSGTASALGYVGTSVFDAVAGRRMRAGIHLLQGGNKKGAVSELFTLPVLSDMFGWTDPLNTVTGKEILNWDDDKRYVDDAAGIALEILTDPTTYMTGGLTGIFGTTTKAGKILERAGVVDDMAKAASLKLGRRIGRREFMARTALKDISIPNTGINAIDKTFAKRLNDAAKKYGYQSFVDAQQSAIGNSRLATPWGVTAVPMGNTPMASFGGGELFNTVQRGLDTTGGKIAANPLTRHWQSWFNKDVSETKSAPGQARMIEAKKEAARVKYQRSLAINGTFQRLKAVGINEPEFMDDLWALSEKRHTESASKMGQPGFRQMALHPEDRDISEIVDSMFPATGYRKYGKQIEPANIPAVRDELKSFVNDMVRDNYDRLNRAREVNIGPEEYNSFAESYRVRPAKYITESTPTKIPKHVTNDMLRILQSPVHGMTTGDIYQQAAKDAAKYGDVRSLWKKAYGGRIDEAVRESKAAAQARGTAGSGRSSSAIETNHPTQRKRKELLKNIPGSEQYAGGQSTLDHLSMDSRISGPMAGAYMQGSNGIYSWSKYGRAARHNLIFSEYMNGDIKRVDEWMRRRDGNLFKVGMQYGDLAPPGKLATDVVQNDDELRVLRETMNAEEHLYNKAGDLAKFFEELDPRHVTEQIPLSGIDPISGHLHSGNGVEDVISNARASLRMFGDAAYIPTSRGGRSVLHSLKKARLDLSSAKSFAPGRYGRQAESLSNFLQINAREGRTEWNVFGSNMAVDDMVDYLGENPNARYIQNGKKKVINPDWLEHEDNRAKILTQFGLKQKMKSLDGGEKEVNQVRKVLEDEMFVKNGGQPLTDIQKAEALKNAKLQAIGGIDRKKDSLLADLYNRNQNEFASKSMRPYSIDDAVVSDAVKSMSLSSTPEVIRGVARVWDKMTNIMRTHFTTAWIPFLARNIQSIGLMDFLTNADNVLNPREIGKAFQRWKWSYDLHSGKTPKGIHKLPMFSDVNFGRSTPLERDKIATDMLRAEFAAAEVADPHGVGQLLGDTPGIDRVETIAIGDTLPGVGAGKRGMQSVRDRLRVALGKMKEDGIDWRHLASAANPLNVRGAFGKLNENAPRSKFAPVRMLEDANDFSEAIGRTATWLGQLSKGVDPLEAAIKSNAAHVNYHGLSNTERQIMRRAIPFYTYTRSMIPHVMRTVLRHQGGAMGNLIRSVNIANGERRESNFIPQQLAGQLAIPLYDKNGVRAYLRPDLPINVINNLFTVGPDAYTTFQNTGLGWLSQMHMLPKAFLETAFGRSTFQKGRNLEDMYSRIGIKDPLTNQIVMMSPLGRYVTQFGPNGVMFDERKTTGEKAFQFLTGNPIAHIDINKATEESLDQALNKALSLEEGVGRSDRFFAFNEEELSPRAKALMRLKVTRSDRRIKDARQKAKDRAAEVNQPPDRLGRLGL